MRALLISLMLAGPAQAATYRAEVDVTPEVAPGERVHVVMTLHWLEESMTTPPVFCVTTPPGWQPEGAVGALRSRKGTPTARALHLGGLPSDQLDPARSGEGWACVVGSGQKWRQGASGTVVFTLRPPEDAQGTVELRTAVGRFDRSVHVGETLPVRVKHNAPVHGPIASDPLLARRVFDALDDRDVLEVEAKSLAGQLSLRQPPPLERRVAFAEQVAQHQAQTLAELAGLTEIELPGYRATFQDRTAESSALVQSAATEWLTRTCAHKERLLAEPENPAHLTALSSLQAELNGLGPALAPWWTDGEAAEVARCTALTRGDVAPVPPPESPELERPEASPAADEPATAPSPE